MSSKFEQLLDYLVNEEQDKANELFHEIVVEKSREIYENLIAEEEDEATEEDMDESMDDDGEATEEDMDESMDEDTEEETVESMFGETDFGGDMTDAFEKDVTDPKFGDESDDDYDPDADVDFDDMGNMGIDGDDAAATKNDIMDLENAIEELKAEFESLMGSLDADGDGDHDTDDHEKDDEDPEDRDDFDPEDEDEAPEDDDDDDDDDMPFGGSKSQGETMREYIEKVTATMDGGLVGARTGEAMTAPKEGKSPISSGAGKPTSGATAKNITQAGKGADEDGTSPKGKVGGLVKNGSGKFVGAGTHNVDKVNSGIKTLKAVSKPSNKEGQGWGSGSGDKAGQTGSVDTKSPLTGAPNRAK